LSDNGKLSYALIVDAKKVSEAKEIVDSLELDDSEISPDSEGYLDAHEEWNNKMYDPGYYTGAKMPHFITKPNSLTRNVFFAVFTIFMPLIFFNARKSLDTTSLLFIFIGSLYVIVVGATIWSFLKKR
jgi:hypothetical protein